MSGKPPPTILLVDDDPLILELGRDCWNIWATGWNCE